MKDKISEIQNYFKSRLLSGEFTLKEMTGYIAKVMVDEYQFVFWTANIKEYPNTCATDFNNSCYGSFIHLSWTKDESIIMADKFSFLHKEAVRRSKREQIEKLKKELENDMD